jgi:hypothetical protein
MASCIVSIFVGLYPHVMVSSTNPAYSLTVDNTASEPYSLHAMTVVVIIFLPIVLAYQCWTYYVFRRRITREQFLPAPPPPPVAPPRPAPAESGPLQAAPGGLPPVLSRFIRGGRHGRKLRRHHHRNRGGRRHPRPAPRALGQADPAARTR